MINPQDFDTSIRPQDDFYHYANGGWLKSNPIPASESSWGSFHVLHEENQKRLLSIVEEIRDAEIDSKDTETALIKNFYLAAIDPKAPEQTGLPILKEQLEKIAECEDVNALMRTVASMHSFGFHALFEHMVDIDEKNSTRYCFRILQGGLGLPDRDYYFHEGVEMEKIRNEYKKIIPRLSGLAGLDITDELIEQIFTLEKSLAEHSQTSTEKRDLEAQYNWFTREELSQICPSFDWSNYFQALGITEEKILVNQPKFFTQLQELLTNTDINIWKKYCSWHTIRFASRFLGENFEEVRGEFFNKILAGTTELQPRWKRVLAVMNASIGFALGKIFVQKYFPQEAKEHMKLLVANLKTAFSERIKKLEWMEESTKQKALEKLAKMNIKIGYPDKWKSYDGLVLNSNNYFENILKIGRFNTQYEINKLGKAIDKDEWLMVPQEVNAYNFYNLNEIVFPAGILQDPFFSIKNTDAENYGAIGSIIGHEITHGFDDQGGTFDAEGNMLLWQSEKDKQAFIKRANALEKQADTHEVLPGLFMKGKLTLGENIADLGGAEIALDAYLLTEEGKKETLGEFAPLQTFFFSFAKAERENKREERKRQLAISDPHAESSFRVNGVVVNMDRFHQAFDVKEGDKMYKKPEDRIKIW